MAVILVSGGLDSALNLAMAAQAGKAKLALTMRYGQRAEVRELAAAVQLAKHYNIEWRSIDVSWLGAIHENALTRSDQNLPQFTLSELNSDPKTQASMKAVWVANRNGVFLNIAAAFAEARNLNEVYVGFNLEEASTFPDNSAAYLQAATNALAFSTLNKVQVKSYTVNWDKTKIMAESLRLDLPLQYVWSCYENKEQRCWKCESCLRTERALRANGKVGLAWLEKLKK